MFFFYEILERKTEHNTFPAGVFLLQENVAIS
jgi:hypothetical protein